MNYDEIDKEMQEIAKSGLQEILILTGESRKQSSIEYIGEACKIAKKYFRVIGLEIYPLNTDEYAYLPALGVLWGFRGEAELTAAGADALADRKSTRLNSSHSV